MSESLSYMLTTYMKKLAMVVHTELPVLVWQRQGNPWDSLSPRPTLNTGLWASVRSSLNKQRGWWPRLSSDFHMRLHTHGCAQMAPCNNRVARTEEIMLGACCAIPSSRGLCSPILAWKVIRDTDEEGKQQPSAAQAIPWALSLEA